MKSKARRKDVRVVKETLSETKTAELLGLSLTDVKKLEKQELLHPVGFIGEQSFFSVEDVARIKYTKKKTLSEEAEEMGQEIQRDVVTSLSLIQRALLVASGWIVGYGLIVVLFAILFILFPLQTASWLGYTPQIHSPLSAYETNQTSNVLAAATSNAVSSPSLLETLFKPVSRSSLNIVKYTNPQAYDSVKRVVILDVNEVIGLDAEGALTPLQPVQFTQSAYLKVADPGLIENLNSQFLQGRKPGKNVGDIAIVGDTTPSENTALSPPTEEITSLTDRIVTLETKSITGITNANLLHSSITINTTSPLGGGGTATLGDTITLTCSTCTTSSSSSTSSGGDFTIAATSGSNATISPGGTLTIAAGSNITTTSDGSGTVSVALSATPTVTTINGLTIANNGSNTLTLAAGKTFTVNNSLTFSGTDGTTFTLPGTSDTLVTLAATQTLANKTISAASNTISGLTNSNLSGSAGITNANLANSSVTINTSTGLSGGASVSLGGNLTLTNTGVTSLVGTANQVTTSGATGAVTLSLPQSIAATSSPTFASLALTNTTNQLVLGTTNLGTLTWSPSSTHILTLPDITDTIIGKTTTDILTNKTLTSPAINGTVTTTGLTLPSFTAAGNISGSGSPTISNFGAINGLTLTAASDGFTITGGTTPRTLTVTGANITVGSTIQPTSTGTLAIQSNGANLISLDAGGAASVQIGTTNASAVTIGRSTITTTIQGTASANTLIVGGGSTITKHLSATASISSGSILSLVCSTVGTVTVTGAAVGDTAIATPTPVTNGIETRNLSWNAYVSSADTVTIRACNVTLGSLTPATQTWRVDVWQH